MIQKIQSTALLFCFLILGMAALAQEQDTGKPDQNTLLWRVSGNGLVKPSYIFGTMHVICKEETEKIITPTLKQAMQSCTQLLFEVNSKNTAALIIASMKGSKMRNDTTLKQLVNKRELKTIMDYFTKHKTAIPLDRIQTMTPMILEGEVSKTFLTCANKSSVEAELTELADAYHVKIDGIASIQEHTSNDDSVSYKEQARTLLKAIADAKNPEKNVYFKIKEMYVAQEMAALNDLFDPDNLNNRFNRIFLANRNKIWIPRLVEKMKTEQIFLAIGCAHLFGKTGVVTLLRKQGYTVEGVPNK